MNISNNTIITIAVVVIIIIGGFFLLQRDNDEEASEMIEETEEVTEDTPSSPTGSDPNETTSPDITDETTPTDSAEEEPVSSETPAPNGVGDVEETIVNTTATVTYTDSGYSPSTITISAGDTVTFINESSDLMWPASAIHPTHRIYPGSSIQKCGTTEEDNIFDSCGRVTSGDSWNFTFTEVGEWKYHNHLRANKTGTVVVE